MRIFQSVKYRSLCELLPEGGKRPKADIRFAAPNACSDVVFEKRNHVIRIIVLGRKYSVFAKFLERQNAQGR